MLVTDAPGPLLAVPVITAGAQYPGSGTTLLGHVPAGASSNTPPPSASAPLTTPVPTGPQS
ncbi:hypothetical protein [Streptomyces sp. NPDC059389]|uniref:hypothetical protein n=1 Tax=Streptomyces sp. NPDC059389 TaxID=3346818 RepID=UPI0036BCA02C